MAEEEPIRINDLLRASRTLGQEDDPLALIAGSLLLQAQIKIYQLEGPARLAEEQLDEILRLERENTKLRAENTRLALVLQRCQ